MEIQSEPVVVSRIEQGFHLAVCGPIHTNVAWLEAEMKKVVDHRPQRVELDLRGSSYISSMGMGVLVAFRKAILAVGGTLRISGIQKRVLGSLKFAGLDKVFAIDDAVVAEG